MTDQPQIADPTLTETLRSTLNAAASGAAHVEALAAAVAPRLASALVERLAADIAARLRIDALAGDDLILSRDEAAKFLGRSPKSLELWASRGIGPRVVQIGPRSIGYRVGDLRAHANTNPSFAREAVAKKLAVDAK